jgi:hypothetical protein
MLASREQQGLLIACLPKHLREIFSDLLDFIKSNDFLMFMDCLIDNIKNLAVRIHTSDKKQEKALIN